MSYKEPSNGRESRRRFVTTLGAAALAATPARAAKRPLEPLSPGIKITLQIGTSVTDDDLTFARQMGVEYVTVGTTGGPYEMFAD